MRKFWMVKWADLDDTNLAQSRSSYVEHPTLDGAMVEANRLARIYPERTFVVLEAAKVVKAEIHTVCKEWIGSSLLRDHRNYERETTPERDVDDEPDGPPSEHVRRSSVTPAGG